jgi:predicted permease
VRASTAAAAVAAAAAADMQCRGVFMSEDGRRPKGVGCVSGSAPRAANQAAAANRCECDQPNDQPCLLSTLCSLVTLMLAHLLVCLVGVCVVAAVS